MKKVLSLVLVMMLLVASLVACGGGDDATTEGPLTIEAVQAKGVLVIGGEENYPPFEFHDDDDNIIGYDIDIWNAICEDLGVELEIVDIPFAGVLTGLDAGQFDVAGCVVGVTAERSESYLFASPVNATPFTITTLKTTTDIVEPEDLDGKVVGCQTGSTPEIFANMYNEELQANGGQGITVKSYTNPADAFLDMENGGCDAVVESLEISRSFVAEDDQLVTVASLPDMVLMAFAFEKEDAELCQFVSDKINAMKADGTLEELQMKWFGYSTVDILPDTSEL